MFLHLQLPGFHAAVHQALHPSTRGRPVAVAVDNGPQAPLFACSPEARAQHIFPGLRADVAMRRCPDLIVAPPDPDGYRRAQRCLGRICGTYTPRVGGTVGRLDLDLTGTEQLWAPRLPEVSPQGGVDGLARTIGSLIRRRCADELCLNVFVGGAARLLIARLAAHLARGSHLAAQGVAVIAAEDAVAVTDLMPVALLAECDDHVRELLDRCGITTIGQLRALSADSLIGLVGPAGAGIYETLHGLRDEVVPQLVDPEPSVSAACRAGPSGAGPETASDMVAVMARELGYRLRQRQLACTRLTLDVTWLDGRTAQTGVRLRYQSAHDQELALAAQRLLEKGSARRVHVASLALTGSGLCAIERQQELFGCDAAQRLEAARDRLRTRFGSEVVGALHAPAVSGI